MKSYARFVFTAVLCLMLGGCYEAFPQIKSASVTYWRGGKPQGTAQQLTQEQVEKLSVWLQNGVGAQLAFAYTQIGQVRDFQHEFPLFPS